ncbi:MAG: efflux RND transporter periplasmic adaptor subunit [Candidatus Coatesbacteria bacterium]|nr:efflux RND transporter periplasmic adaptor subunit [Candidatus Coatesbacteria bacterium]
MKINQYMKFTCLAIIIIFAGCSYKDNKEQIIASGNFEVVEVKIASKSSGEIKDLYFNEGSKVRCGDTLAAIDCSYNEIRLGKAEAGVELAKSQLRLILKGVRIEDINQARESANQAQAQVSQALRDFQRARYLYESNSASLKQLQDAETHYHVAMAQFNGANHLVKKLKRGSRKEEIQAAQANVKQLESEVNLLKKLINDSKIKAPINGIITNKPYEKGELVSEGMVIATIARIDTVKLTIYVSESELGKLNLGKEAIIRVDSHPGKDFKGKIIYISPTSEFTPKTIQTKDERIKLVFAVKIEVPNPEEILKPGMPADAYINTKSK